MNESQKEIPVNGKPADIINPNQAALDGADQAADNKSPIDPIGIRDGIIEKKVDIGTQPDINVDKARAAGTISQVEPGSGTQLAELPEPEINTPLLAAPKSPWQELPIKDSPDPHAPDHKKGKDAPHNLKVIGARVRGKSHKHVGTNCDDWFDFGFARDWTIMAVADGVGSRKLSRVGAKEACGAAIKSLEQDLGQVTMTQRTSKAQFKNRGRDGKFPDGDVNQVEQSLFRAMNAAYHACEDARDARKGRQEYIVLLEHEPDVHDFSTTLLLAVHNCFTLEGKDYDFVMTLQVGDGMIAAVNADNKLSLLAKPDSGEFAGQVVPITHPKIRDERELRSRVYTRIDRLKAIMLMTDGVADDFFPNDPEMLTLYDELMKQGIIASTPNGETLVKKEDALPETAAEILCGWLDSYLIKGSFDDRTLVVLFREDHT